MTVAPFVGAWVEITTRRTLGLPRCVAPFVGAWVEIYSGACGIVGVDGRSLCGSVG